MTPRHCRTAWPVLLALVAVAGCGEGRFALSNDTYEPKIVIQGFMRPGPGVEQVYIWRNFRPDGYMRSMRLIPSDTQAHLIDQESGTEYELRYHEGQTLRDYYFEYPGEDLVIEPGKTYRLDVTATIEGQALHAWGTTTVPRAGFRIAGVSHQRLPYRPLDGEGNPVNFVLTIDRSPDSRLYLATMRPAPGVADTANFVYDNPFVDRDPEEVLDDLPDFSYTSNWIQNAPLEVGQSTIEMFWLYFWFYGHHDITVYATDVNYATFLQTYGEVQEPDGNFHEPSFSIEGDGIGVFGSVVADSIRIEVLRE